MGSPAICQGAIWPSLPGAEVSSLQGKAGRWLGQGGGARWGRRLLEAESQQVQGSAAAGCSLCRLRRLAVGLLGERAGCGVAI
jgi:hypothetical protein